MSKDSIAKHIQDFLIVEKKDNIDGLQLAGLVVAPIGRAVIGKKKKKDWEIIFNKFRKGKNGPHGHGLIVLPK